MRSSGVDDDVWHLGDFARRNSKDFKNYARALQGRIHLIRGNHDNDAVRNWEGWASSQDLAEVVVEGQRLILCHYGMRVWRGSHHGAIHLCGHSHGSLPGDSRVSMWVSNMRLGGCGP